MRKDIFPIVFFLISALTVKAHPVHVSISNLEINTDSNSIDYSIQFMSEDLSFFINERYNTFLSFGERSRMTTKEQEAVVDYVNRNFILLANNDTLANEFVAWKYENESVWLYFTSKLTAHAKTLQIINTLMTDWFIDQNNLLIAQTGNKQVGFEFNKRNTHYSIDLE